MIFLVNLNISGNLASNFPILKGNYTEFTDKWYGVVGTAIVFLFCDTLDTLHNSYSRVFTAS